MSEFVFATQRLSTIRQGHDGTQIARVAFGIPNWSPKDVQEEFYYARRWSKDSDVVWTLYAPEGFLSDMESVCDDDDGDDGDEFSQDHWAYHDVLFYCPGATSVQGLTREPAPDMFWTNPQGKQTWWKLTPSIPGDFWWIFQEPDYSLVS